jgi:outer membrane protein TolC
MLSNLLATAGIAVAMSVTVIGCTPAAYRRSADLQVGKILADRKQSTLDYEPETSVPTTVPARAPRVAYEKVPATPMPPPTTSPIEPSRIELRYGPIGPVQRLPDGVGVPTDATETGVEGPEETRRQTTERLALGPPTPGVKTERLDLFGALAYATAHSREYRTRMEDLYLAALDVTLERHLLSPRPFVSQSFQFTGGDADVNYAAAMSATTAAGVRQRLPYGGEVVAQTLVTFVNALTDEADSGESAAVVLSGSIPLLRGAGMVNLEPLIQSERSVVYAVRSFEEFRRSFALDVASSYFRVLTRIQVVNNRKTQVANYQLLLDRTRALYAAGRIRFLEVQRSGSAYLRAENTLITAEESLRNAVDDFKILLGMDVQAELEVVPVELETAEPDLAGDMLAVANRFRLDLQTARDRIDDAQRQIEYAKNSLLPELNLTGQTSVGNRPNTPARQVDGRSFQYSAGIVLDLPVDRLAERNDYRRSLIDFERARRNFDLLRDNIEADVRASVRDIKSSQATLALQTRAIELARRRLEFANELLKQGKTEARDLVEAQTDLIEAQDDYEQARADLQIALLRYMRDSGTLRVDPKAGAIGRALDRRESVNTFRPAGVQ